MHPIITLGNELPGRFNVTIASVLAYHHDEQDVCAAADPDIIPLTKPRKTTS